MKALQKGLDQLCEEGATQLFRPLRNNDLILGAVGQLQFDVVAFRLQDEYGVQCVFETRSTCYTARWVCCDGSEEARGIPRQGPRQPGARSRRRAGLPGADARQPAADAGALARRHASARRASTSRARRERGVPAQAVLRRRPVLSWALYDWANSAFATTVMAGFFPVFFKQYWNAGVVATESTFRLGVTSGIASLIVALLAPVLGAIADRSGARVRLLMLFTVLGAAATAGARAGGAGALAGCGRAVPRWRRSASGAASSSTTRCCCTWPSPTNTTVVSGYGYALGYLGGGLLFAVNVLMTLQPAVVRARRCGRGGALVVRQRRRLVVRVRAAVRVLRAREARRARRAGAAARRVRQGFGELRGTLREIRATGRCCGSSPPTVLYIDGVNTIIKMAVDYGLSLGLRPVAA